MSDTDKSTRLLKVAKELNIGTATVTEYLAKKGFQVENKPMAKITDDMYEVLLKEFQGDKNTKEEAKQITIGKVRREEIHAEENKPLKASSNQDDEGDEILIKNVSAVKAQPLAPVQAAAARVAVPAPVITIPIAVVPAINVAPAQELVIPAPVVQLPVVVNQVAVIPVAVPAIADRVEKTAVKAEPDAEKIEVPQIKEEVKPIVISSSELNKEITPKETKPEILVNPEPILPQTRDDQAPQLKIVGKIDLTQLNPRTRPEKRHREEAPNAKTTASAQPGITANQKQVTPASPDKPVSPAVAPKAAQPFLNKVQKAQPAANAIETSTKPVPQNPIITAPANSAADAATDAADPAKKVDERLNTNYQKLSGPSIIGKIELPVARKNQPVASSASPLEQARRKRKRKDAPPPRNPGQIPHVAGAPITDRKVMDQSRNNSRPPFKKDDRPRVSREEPTEKEIQDQIKATLARLSGAGKSGKFAQRAKLRRQKRDDNASSREDDMAEQELQSKILKVTEYVTANELAKLMDAPVNQVISTCMSLGLFVSINQRLDAETLTIVAEEFGFQVDFVSADNEVKVEEEIDNEEDLLPRAPVVTVMGHVDHGKTSLLDYVRKANVIGAEAGGITQHIGAYEVQLENGKKITFLDTPGHEAFTAMRARGAQSTDIVIIVIAADDAVMPQTTEAINHAKAAGVPMVFAFNKMDRPGANPDKIREQLSAMNILVEEWGGKFQTQEISAKKGTNVNELLEKVLLEAEILDLKANPDKRAVGTVIEAALDKGRGIVTTVMVQSGTLRVGDPILAGCYSGRVKAMFNERQQKVSSAGPSTPVLVLGMQGSPQAGDKFMAMESETEAREIANKRLQLQREQGIRTQKHITLDEIGRRLAIGNFKELNIIVKGDVDGSIEALADSLLKLSTPEIQVNILHKSVGQISESDVVLASASDAIIIGFQVRPSLSARKLAEHEQIDIRLYSIIYDAINEIKLAMEGMLSPVFEEKIVCNVEVRETFKISKVGTIAGCYVLDGKITRNTKVRLVRDGVVVFSGELESLKRFKDDVKEVSASYECGLNIKNFNDIQVNDIIEGYEQVEVKRKLA